MQIDRRETWTAWRAVVWAYHTNRARAMLRRDAPALESGFERGVSGDGCAAMLKWHELGAWVDCGWSLEGGIVGVGEGLPDDAIIIVGMVGQLDWRSRSLIEDQAEAAVPPAWDLGPLRVGPVYQDGAPLVAEEAHQSKTRGATIWAKFCPISIKPTHHAREAARSRWGQFVGALECIAEHAHAGGQPLQRAVIVGPGFDATPWEAKREGKPKK
jgi:hypothetical protein